MSVPNFETDYEGWLEWRRARITSTDTVKILEQSEWASLKNLPPGGQRLLVYNDKMGLIPPTDSALMRRGRKMEQLVADEYCLATERRLRKQPPREHKLYPEIACSIDRQILAGDDNGTAMWEGKTAGSHMLRKIKMDGLPVDYYLQVQHNLEVWNYLWGGIGLLCPDTFELVKFDIERDDEICEQIIYEDREFFKNHIVEHRPPDLTLPKLKPMPKIGGELIKLTSEQFGDAVAAYEAAKLLEQEAKSLLDDSKKAVQVLMDDNNAMAVEGFGYRFFWKDQDGRKMLDQKALKVAHPDIYVKFMTQGAPSRPFRPFKMKEYADE